MQCKDEVVRLIGVRHLQGNGKNGRPYNFSVLQIADENLERYEVSVEREDLNDGILPQWILDVAEEKGEIVCDLRIVPNSEDTYQRTCKLIAGNFQPAK